MTNDVILYNEWTDSLFLQERMSPFVDFIGRMKVHLLQNHMNVSTHYTSTMNGFIRPL